MSIGQDLNAAADARSHHLKMNAAASIAGSVIAMMMRDALESHAPAVLTDEVHQVFAEVFERMFGQGWTPLRRGAPQMPRMISCSERHPPRVAEKPER